ncbi:hypothetical protein [Microbulbifer thermotolerans]|uniref:Uncharacterized protein n=1 Tax=Microbulbifer thermotolerans TaxID=252514 RepID=A0A143HKY4_MICTH|nr:hypothetical protein [Microbulbifer thermotolerans]AMX02379.1 hypothetical protein A3224_07105 [Microbulbifer thermotolerans]MCX2779974.1 hypothetical protein [Microbulbifer thermotolerans]MCX2781829.1 hypothetical protein [Microbulbifer thermotolerans]MCX2795170.1 hypothetical protein [Microbulbifer thermotolerans]MCX2801801.1 hypothetical protein [Microbulbifer thermotolerans]
MVTAGSLKKIQFCAGLALLLGVMPVGAGELQLPLQEVRQQLTELSDEIFSRKLKERRERLRHTRDCQAYTAEKRESCAPGLLPRARLTVI